ncbi:MAG TPA: amino acid adenylation domain-containing protein, partial [Clostridia bacterium]|nr:amino acid adenylation domain-containing protein [Clostridia bacterium]
DGEINMHAFSSAWGFVAENNEVLRTVFRWDKLEQPVQIIMDKLSIPINVLNFEELDDSKKQISIEKTIEEDISRGIDIQKSPFRITLCRLSKTQNVMIISNHHILYDGWSNGILINEFMEAYESLIHGRQPNIAAPKYSIKEYLRWLQGQDKGKQKKYWQEYLYGFNAKTEMPLAAIKSGSILKTKEYELTFSSRIAERIINFTRTYSYTPAEIFYAAWGILLRKYNNSGDVIFGTTISGRNQQIKGINNMAGLFVNTLPLRVKAGPDESICSVLGSIRDSIYEREDFESTSLSEIKLYSELENSDSLFDSIIAVENYPIDEKLLGKKGSISVTGFASHEKTNFDLTIAVLPFEDIKIKFIYNSEIFSESAIEKLSKQLEVIIDRITENPDLSLGRMEILSEEEKDLLINKFNDTASAFPKDKTLQQLFEEQASKNLNSTALRQGGKEMSYGELNCKANRIAAFLRNKGIVRNSVVGLMTERSFDMIAAILGILKAGGAYLPIDPSYPKDRIIDMLNDSEASLLIAGDDVFNAVFNDVESFNNSCSKEVVLVSRMAEEASNYSPENPECVNSSEDCAYVMYTSGSTGKPKGILTTHYNVSRVVKNTNYIEILNSDVILQLSNYAFDGSTFDIFGALLNGAKLVLTQKEIFLDIRKLSKLIRDEKITVFFITTALFNTLVDLDAECLKGVRKVLFGGERVSLPHVRKALESVGRDKLIHVYGPTETTTFAAYYPINEIDEDLGTIPIGKPVSNTEAYVLDRDGNLSPLGCPGELYISGDGVAKGYLNRPELSGERFLRHPFKAKGLIYRTGDLVKMLPDGYVVFLDRMDGQVKLRGFRVELGEIESRLLSLEKVKEAVVTAEEDKSG